MSERQAALQYITGIWKRKGLFLLKANLVSQLAKEKQAAKLKRLLNKLKIKPKRKLSKWLRYTIMSLWPTERIENLVRGMALTYPDKLSIYHVRALQLEEGSELEEITIEGTTYTASQSTLRQ